MLGAMSLVEWKLISKLVRRDPTAERVDVGAFRIFNAASGHTCGAIKRIEVRFDPNREAARVLVALVHADSQLKLDVSAWSWTYSKICSSISSCKRSNFICWSDTSAGIARRSKTRSRPESTKKLWSLRRRWSTWVVLQ
ncbi:hypothetical protein PHISCL_03424 [Aspergillus sclerotialis]|uniref:Uncharacterized protein n=1 Tax=Aspergillus sclerotialis TaxID=2070753 RepID=A0A3A2ZY15_9EURO|nr:hypothetical protein PHISCL_03424 [Aspergillus sclerotialis]